MSPLEHAGFRVCWAPEQGVFELWSVVGDRRLSTTGTLWTAEHVLAELERSGFWIGSTEVLDALLVTDELVSATAGDPFVVGDPGSGLVGVASSDGRMLEPLVVPDGGFGWIDAPPDRLGATAVAVLRAVAPMTFGTPMDSEREDALREGVWPLLIAMSAGRPELALNVRVVQRWALAAMDLTGSLDRGLAAGLLDDVNCVDEVAVDRAVGVLRAIVARPGRPVRRRARGSGRGRSRQH